NIWKSFLKSSAWRNNAVQKSSVVRTSARQTGRLRIDAIGTESSKIDAIGTGSTTIDAIGTGSTGIDNIRTDCTKTVGSMIAAKNSDAMINARLTDAKKNGVIMIGAVDKCRAPS
ncbi:hypothetical protein BGZ74_007628, partial [Mortierella antarctica]